MLLWDDPPSYFDDPEGFIFFRPDVPEELLEKSGPVKTNSLLPEETSEPACNSVPVCNADSHLC